MHHCLRCPLRPILAIQFFLILGAAAAGVRGECSPAIGPTLSAPAPQGGERFGSAVAVTSDIAVVSAPQAAGTGAVDVFLQVGPVYQPQWVHGERLEASDGASGDLFGASVAAADGVIVVGAPHAYVGPSREAGVAYVFVSSNGPDGVIWHEQARLTAPMPAAFDNFGLVVGVSEGGQFIFVGAGGADPLAKNDAGAVYVFSRIGGPDGAEWLYFATVIAVDAAPGDRFGDDLAVSAGRLIVGASRADLPGRPDAGAAYVFAQSGDPGAEVWTQEAKLLAPDGVGYDNFGVAVAIAGDTAVVGAPADNTIGGNDAGSVHVFSRAGDGTWLATAQLLAADGAEGDYFGAVLALDGDVLLIGAPSANPGGVNDAGATELTSACGDVDLNGDGAIDLADFAVFQAMMVGQSGEP